MSHKGLFPTHVWDEIANHCHVLDLVALSRTCRLFHKRYGNCEEIAKWKGWSLDEKIFYAAKKDNDSLLHLFIPKCQVSENLSGLRGAAIGGHLHLVEFFISKGADDWNWGLSGAAQGGHLNLVELFISKGANNWYWGLKRAAQGGHFHLVKLFISKGALNFDSALRTAQLCGHSDIVEFLEIAKTKYNGL